MRVLLDESLPRGLKGLLPDLDVVTVPDQGWRGMKNGELLGRAGEQFDVFLTADQSLEHQQNLADLAMAIVVLVAESNRLEAYVPLAPRIVAAIKGARPGEVVRVAA